MLYKKPLLHILSCLTQAVVNEDIHGDMPALRAELTRLKEDLAVKDKLLEEIKASGEYRKCLKWTIM